jgi:hypothetical protein
MHNLSHPAYMKATVQYRSRPVVPGAPVASHPPPKGLRTRVARGLVATARRMDHEVGREAMA